MRPAKTIRVFYPLESGRIVLRTDSDWESSVEAVAVDPDRSCFEFRIEFDRPFFYFKPVLIDAEGKARWAQGENVLVVTTSDERRDVYPFFLEDRQCSICELMTASTTPANAHRFRVFLPPGYSENSLKRYPVVYMHDGQNLFLPDEAFLGNTWKTDDVLGVLSGMNAIEEAIVVGIHPIDREREYTQVGYGQYSRFVIDVLKPLVDARYRTLAGPESTAVIGSSLGGVVSFYMGWQHPDVFGKIACLSSTFTWRDDLLTRVLEEPKRKIKIYMDSGWPHDNYEATRSMRDRLICKGYRSGSDFMYLAFPRAAHNEGAWASRSHIAFQFLLGREAL